MAKKIFKQGDEITMEDVQESFRIASGEYTNILTQNILLAEASGYSYSGRKVAKYFNLKYLT